MKFKRKRSALLMLGTSLMVVVSACSSGGAKTPAASSAVAATSTPAVSVAPKMVEITVNNAPQESDKANYENFQNTIKAFQAKYPNIKVTGDTWRFSPDSFVTRFSGGTAPTVVLLPFTEAGGVVDHGYAADITDLMKKDPDAQQFSDAALRTVSKDSKIFGVPGGGYVMGLLYNKKLLDAAGLSGPPKTWDELESYAKKLTDKSKNRAGLALITKAEAGTWIFLNFVYEAGGTLEKRGADGKVQATFNTPEVVKAMQLYRDLRWKDDALQSNLLLDADSMFPLVAQEQAAMTISSAGWIDLMVNKYGGHVGDLFMASMPMGPKSKDAVLGGAFNIINAKATPEQKDAAFKWIMFQAADPDQREGNLKAASQTKGKLIGLPGLPMWKPEMQKKIEDQIKKYTNVPLENYKDFNDNSTSQPEPPVEAQKLYGMLAPVIQAVLTDKNADIQPLLDKANAQFQKEVLDPINSK